MKWTKVSRGKVGGWVGGCGGWGGGSHKAVFIKQVFIYLLMYSNVDGICMKMNSCQNLNVH